MLGLLHIENIAVIRQADVDFRPGLNVLTGETGAGKSIIIDAIGALLGERTSRDLIRTGERFASVSGWFSGVGGRAAAILADADVELTDGELSLERRLYADGRNVCRANGSPIPLSVLKELGACLVSIHGQHDSRVLLDPAVHIGILDGFAGVGELFRRYVGELSRLKAIRARQRAVLSDAGEIQRRRDTLTFQINELESAALVPGEYEELERARARMRDAERLANAVACALGELTGDERTAAEKLARAAGFVRAAGDALGPEVTAAAAALEDAAASVRDCEAVLDAAQESLNFSERDADRLEDRLALLSSLRKKYGGTTEAALAFLDAARAELDGLENLEQTAARLDGEYRAQYAVTLSAAQELSAARQDAARRLEAAVDAEFGFLCMPGARFSVRLGARTRDGRTLLGNDGIDTVEFYLAANRGEDARPLARSASGGELSRVMLALCTVGGSGGPSADTMIFDEIDAGISGIAAGRVADRLARLAAERQILCVTHLSQIAAAADAHFAIRKEEENGRTLTRVSELDRGGRIAELARINAGEGFSEAIRAAAAEQLDDSARRKKGLSPHD